MFLPYQKNMLVLGVLLGGFVLGNATLTPKSGQKHVKLEKFNGPVNKTVFQRDLVKSNVSPKDIISNHQAYHQEVDNYNFDGLVLGYVTPWNNKGYDIGRIFGNKFTHISPVWLQFHQNQLDEFVLNGLHDIDPNWMIAIKNAGRERRLKVVPRLIFEQWHTININQTKRICDQLIGIALKYKFDGFVFEAWFELLRVSRNIRLTMEFLKALGDTLQAKKLSVFLVIPPLKHFQRNHFDFLYDSFTGFSLMTYDYSGSDDGPVAPYFWVKECIESLTNDMDKRQKILTGLNFYGYKYNLNSGGGSEAVLGTTYIELLERHLSKGKILYNNDNVEHIFTYKQNRIHYPTLFSIQKRLELCKLMETGVAIWELGQGLDYFYDLL